MQERVEKDTPLDAPRNGTQQPGAIFDSMASLFVLSFPKVCTSFEEQFRFVGMRQLWQIRLGQAALLVGGTNAGPNPPEGVPGATGRMAGSA